MDGIPNINNEGFDGFADDGDTFGGDGYDYEDFSSFDDFDGEALYYDNDYESDEFLKKLWRGAKKVAGKVAPIAKKFAPIAGKVIGGAFGGPLGAMAGSAIGNVVSNLEDDFDGYASYTDTEGESDTEDEMSALDFMDFDSDAEDMAEYMADLAVKAPRPVDTAAAAGAITTALTARAPAKVKAIVPTLSSASARVASAMKKSPQSTVLVRVMPTVAKKTIATLTKKAAKGKPVNPEIAKRVMAKHAVATLTRTPELAKAHASNQAKTRKLNLKAVGRAERFDVGY